MSRVLLHKFLLGEVAWLLQVAVLLLKRWIRFLAREMVQSSTKDTKHTENHKIRISMLEEKFWLAFKMLIPTEIQYLQSQR